MANLQVPSPRTFSVSETQTAAYLDSVRDGLTFLLNPPIATVFQSSAQGLTTGTAAPVGFNNSAVDSYGGHSNSTNNSRYVAQVAGWYTVGGALPMAGSAAGTYRKGQIYVNGSPIAYATTASPPINSAGIATAVAVASLNVFLNAGDYVELYAQCDTTGVSVSPNATNEAYMTVHWAHV